MVFYSQVLMDFIEPLLSGNEDNDEYLAKAWFGQTAWNYSIAEVNNLPYGAELKATIQKLNSMYPDMSEPMKRLVERKIEKFNDHNQFIFSVELRHKPDGTVSLYVESVPVDKLIKK
ncbi:MAG: hypothetical protein JJU28_21890 [Cyclobacteriaceae bacterium]|nr:hypothetical protein [Cyclobacteriaceae bacterium]